MNAPEMRDNALLPSVQCRGCPSTFQPKRRWQAFCSDSCRSEWHRKKKLTPDERLVELERRVAALEAKLG